MTQVYQMPDKNLVITICKGLLMFLIDHLLSSTQFHLSATAVMIICFNLEQTAKSQ